MTPPRSPFLCDLRHIILFFFFSFFLREKYLARRTICQAPYLRLEIRLVLPRHSRHSGLFFLLCLLSQALNVTTAATTLFKKSTPLNLNLQAVLVKRRRHSLSLRYFLNVILVRWYQSLHPHFRIDYPHLVNLVKFARWISTEVNHILKSYPIYLLCFHN